MKLQFLKFRTKKAIALIALIIIIPALFQQQCAWSENNLFPFKQFVKYEKNPILSPKGNGFESKGTYNPGVIIVDDTFYMFYRAQDKKGQSSIGLAKSENGMNFKRNSKPVIAPEFDYEVSGWVKNVVFTC